MDKMPKYGIFVFRFKNKAKEVIYQLGTFYHRTAITKEQFNSLAKDSLIIKMDDLEAVHLKDDELIKVVDHLQNIVEAFEGEHQFLYDKKIEIQNQMDSLTMLTRLVFSASKNSKLSV